MEDAVFEKLKELYHPKFWEVSADSLIADAIKRSSTRRELTEPLRERITDLISEYGYFGFYKTETGSGDRLTFCFQPGYSYSDAKKGTVFIGAFRNCSCAIFSSEHFFIEQFYADAAGAVYNQDHRLIAENITDFWEYVIETEYDHHPEITAEVMRIMRDAGWYEGRRINIDALLKECMEDDIFPSDAQIAFLEEFGGLSGIGQVGEEGFSFACKRRGLCFANLAKRLENPRYTQGRWELQHYGAGTLCVGWCAGEWPVFLSPDGQLIARSQPVGRNIWEGIQCIVGY